MVTYSIPSKTNKQLVTIDIDATAEAAIKLMQEKKIRHLIVVNEGKVCGLLSNRDAMKAITTQITDFYEFRVKKEDIHPDAVVRDLMTWPPITVLEDTSLNDVIDKFLKSKISSVLIVNAKNEVTDIITTDDLLKILKTHLLGKEKSFWSTSLIDRAYSAPIQAVMETLANTGI